MPGSRGAATITCHRGGSSLGWSVTPPPPRFPVARWLPGSLVHICPLTLCSSLISCSRPRRLASFVPIWLRLCITQLFTLVPSEPGWTCATHPQPCGIRTNPVKHLHVAYLHIHPLRVQNVHIFAYAKILRVKRSPDAHTHTHTPIS